LAISSVHARNHDLPGLDDRAGRIGCVSRVEKSKDSSLFDELLTIIPSAHTLGSVLTVPAILCSVRIQVWNDTLSYTFVPLVV